MSSEIKYSNEKYIKSCLWWIEETEKPNSISNESTPNVMVGEDEKQES